MFSSSMVGHPRCNHPSLLIPPILPHLRCLIIFAPRISLVARQVKWAIQNKSTSAHLLFHHRYSTSLLEFVRRRSFGYGSIKYHQIYGRIFWMSRHADQHSFFTLAYHARLLHQSPPSSPGRFGMTTILGFSEVPR
jgi:hypothetical protein